MGASSSSDASAAKEALQHEPMRKACKAIENCLADDSTNRYQAISAESEKKTNWLLKSERKLAEYFGMKYGIGVASGGLAIMLGLKAMKRVHFPEVREEDMRVYSNSFTFNAVPSAIVNAGLPLVLCETTSTLVIDLVDLESQILTDQAKGHAGKQILVLSYMRARVPDMDEVLRICSEYKVMLLEDNAHGYGVEWKGRKVGSFGLVSTISTQSNKLINTGEGGFCFTSDPDIMSFFMFSSGCYEELYKKHEEMMPPIEVLKKYRYTVPNFSCRMSNMAAALVWPQIEVLHERIDAHNKAYDRLVELVTAQKDSGVNIEFIPMHHNVSPVWDSLQMRVLPPAAFGDRDGSEGSGEASTVETEGPSTPYQFANITPSVMTISADALKAFAAKPDSKIQTYPTKELPELRKFVAHMAEEKYKLQIFSTPDNARYYPSWEYLKFDRPLPQTDHVLANVLDMRLSCTESEESVSKMASALVKCYRQAYAVA